MRIEEVKYTDIKQELVDKILFNGIEYSQQEAELAVVLGSSSATKYRVPMAATLYSAGKVKKILLCGGNKFSDDGKETESNAMKKKSIELGVDELDIFTETKSQNTKENVINAKKFIDEHFPNIDKVIIVTTTFHMKRSLLLARKVFGEKIQVIPCPADDINTKRDTWNKNKIGYERAVGEVVGIVDYAKQNLIDTFEV